MLEVSERVFVTSQKCPRNRVNVERSMLAKFIVPPLLSTKLYVAELS